MILNRFPGREAFRSLAETHNVIPVCTEMLADTETPVSLLRKCYRPPTPLFLFESVEGGERWGRYSFLGMSAHARIQIHADKVRFQEGDQVEEISHGRDPFSVLRRIMQRYRAAAMPQLPRFWGGMVGYLAYEMVSFFEAIPNRLAPNRPLAEFIIPDAVLIFDNVSHTLFVLAVAFTDGFDSADAAFDSASERTASLLSIIESPAAPPEAPTASAPVRLRPGIDENAYRERVNTTKGYIRSGDIIQAVISQPFIGPAPPDLLALYRAQRHINPSPYLFFLHLGKTALIGSSPETMVRLDHRVATLRPIAGTRRRGATEQEDRDLANELLNDEKERAEHLMLVDLGRNDLGRVAETGTVQVNELMVVERYSHVMHLVSNINCDLTDEHDAWDLLAATFPAGTLSGAPKVRAMEIIAELERSPRGPYGGAVGYVSFTGNMDMAITIRTACVEDGRLTVRAGAGIVADSDPESERIETVNKAMAIDRALQLINR